MPAPSEELVVRGLETREPREVSQHECSWWPPGLAPIHGYVQLPSRGWAQNSEASFGSEGIKTHVDLTRGEFG
jgi:hypothetical protein